MGWKKVELGNTHDFEKNATVEGVYIQKKEGVGPNKSKIYVLRTEANELVSVWGSTVLDNQLSGVPFNLKVKITFLGMAKSEKAGRKDYKNFLVELWED